MDSLEKRMIIQFTPYQTTTLPKWMLSQKLWFKTSLLLNLRHLSTSFNQHRRSFAFYTVFILFFMYLVNQYDVLATKQLHRTFSIMWLQNYNDSSSLSGIYHCHWFIIVIGSSLSLMHHCHWCIPVTDSSLSRIRYCHLFFTVTDSSLVQWFFTVTGSLSLSMILQYLFLIHYFILVTNFSPNLIPHCKLFLTVNDTSFSLTNYCYWFFASTAW